MATYKKITSTGDDVLTGSKRIIGVRLVAGAVNTSAVLFEGTQVGANDFCKLSVLVSGDVDTEVFDDGITVSTLSVTLTGASAILYVYYA